MNLSAHHVTTHVSYTEKPASIQSRNVEAGLQANIRKNGMSQADAKKSLRIKGATSKGPLSALSALLALHDGLHFNLVIRLLRMMACIFNDWFTYYIINSLLKASHKRKKEDWKENLPPDPPLREVQTQSWTSAGPDILAAHSSIIHLSSEVVLCSSPACLKPGPSPTSMDSSSFS